MGAKHIKWVLGIAGLFFFVFFIFFFVILLGGEGLPFGDKVAVVEVDGIITEPESINKQIKEFVERDDVKAIVVRINSPGGGVGPSQEIYREVKKASAKKKIIASMGAVAASGGYYIAAAADKIVANPGTITGSIGVIMEFANAEELLNKIGFKGYVIKSGEYKDIGSPLRGMKDDEKRLLQNVIDDVHQQFVGIVAENRKLKIDAVKKFADGRIFSGQQAKDIGLVDDIGNFQDAIDIAASMASIKGKPIVLYPEKKGIRLWDIIFGDAASTLGGQMLKKLKGGYGGLQYLFPYSI
ncbi:MAG: signal peptide peptidase SppA [Deltaproteobacteria bacterium]|nr:signal peptide peptidase SppA [Deltaproteobacteria bacterium]